MRKLAILASTAAVALLAGRVVLAQTPAATPATPAAVAADPPAGPGLSTVKEKCAACHSLTTVFGQRRTPEDWEATVALMVDRGADLSADEQSVVTSYLSSHYAAPAK